MSSQLKENGWLLWSLTEKDRSIYLFSNDMMESKIDEQHIQNVNPEKAKFIEGLYQYYPGSPLEPGVPRYPNLVLCGDGGPSGCCMPEYHKFRLLEHMSGSWKIKLKIDLKYSITA